jgi:hypothetical protein
MTAIMLLWASLAVTPAKAASMTFGFEGIVSTINPSSPTFNNEGDGFDGDNTIYLSGSYTFDPGTGLGTTPVSQYSNVISRFEFTLHRDAVSGVPGVPSVNYSYTSIPHSFGSTITVGHDVTDNTDLAQFPDLYDPLILPVGPLDGYRLVIPLSSDSVPPSFEFQFLHDNITHAGPFSDSSLGGTSALLFFPPGINWLQEAHAGGNFRIGLPGSGEIVNGTMLSMHLVATPLPPAVILFGAGLVSLIGLGARNWRQRKDSLPPTSSL